MPQATYRHYPSFTRRYVRSVMKMMGLPKKPRIEAEVFDQMVQDEGVVHSINGELLMLEWHHGREGRVVVPEPSLSQWLQTVKLSQVQGDAWSWPWEFSTLSFPTGQAFHGHPVDGALVAWVDSTALPGRYEAFLGAHGNAHGVDMEGLGEPWLIVAIHDPLDARPGLDPTMLRGAFRPSQISDFINREAIAHAGGRAQPLADEEGMILRAVVRYVLSVSAPPTPSIPASVRPVGCLSSARASACRDRHPHRASAGSRTRTAGSRRVRGHWPWPSRSGCRLPRWPVHHSACG